MRLLQRCSDCAKKWCAGFFEYRKATRFETNREMLVSMMTSLFEVKKPVYREALIKEYGTTNYRKFSKYCLGGQKPYAIENGSDPNPQVELTQEGIRVYLQMDADARHQRVQRAGIKATAGSAMLAASALLMDKFRPGAGAENGEIILFWSSVMVLVGFGIGFIVSTVGDLRHQ